MGNSPSKKTLRAKQVSRPSSLKSKSDEYPDLTRRPSHSSFAASSYSGSGSHRRSKSAAASGERILPQAPPSYREATTSDQNGLLVPGSQPPKPSCSQGDPRRRNPFRTRAESPGVSLELGQSSKLSPETASLLPGADDSAVATPIDNAHEHASYPERYTAKWTTEEERLAYLRQPLRQESYEDALETLRKYNTILVVDDSSSMNKGQRWQEARTALAALADVAAQYDADGIDVYFLNNRNHGKNMKSAAEVKRLFDCVCPRGFTPIGERLDELLRDYLDSLDEARRKGQESAIKPVNYVVITDGAPTDEPADVIVSTARRLDDGNYLRSQVGIQFVQIGSDKHATEFLRQLDDDLAASAGVRDIVDTTPYLGVLNAEIVIKILIGGINKRVDRRGGQSVMSSC